MQYWLRGGLGSTLIGAGLSTSIEAGFWKHDATKHILLWIGLGTLGLVVFIAGLALFVNAAGYHQATSNQQ
jgi:hypothetical protein